MDREMLELYSDYLLASFGQTSATRLSQLLEGADSHDQITRFLHQGVPLSKTLWRLAKPLVRHIQHPDGVLIVDDSVEEKRYSSENGTIEWHYDHSVGRVVKGLNFITAFYSSPLEGVRYGVPVGCEVIQKRPVWNEKKACTEMKSPTTKNEHYRALLQKCLQNAVEFKYVLNDSWFSGAENMNFVVVDLKKHFVMALKENRGVVVKNGQDSVTWTGALRELAWNGSEVKAVYLSDVDFPSMSVATSSKTKMEVSEYCIWPVMTRPYLTRKPSSCTKNGGVSRNITNRLNSTPALPSLQPAILEHK